MNQKHVKVISSLIGIILTLGAVLWHTSAGLTELQVKQDSHHSRLQKVDELLNKITDVQHRQEILLEKHDIRLDNLEDKN